MSVIIFSRRQLLELSFLAVLQKTRPPSPSSLVKPGFLLIENQSVFVLFLFGLLKCKHLGEGKYLKVTHDKTHWLLKWFPSLWRDQVGNDKRLLKSCEKSFKEGRMPYDYT